MSIAEYERRFLCACGREKSDGARSCRRCWRSGKGAQKGRGHARSTLTIFREAARLLRGRPVGAQVMIDGYHFKRTAVGETALVAGRLP